MTEASDLEDMIQILNTCIEIHTKEEEYFRRSARLTSRPVVKMMLTEIAGELAQYRENLEGRKQKLLIALSEMQAGKGSLSRAQ